MKTDGEHDINFRYVIHADGSSLNTTDSHRWAIHNSPPGKDFYDWQGRCLSTNQVYNPYKVKTFKRSLRQIVTPARICSFHHFIF